MNIEAFNLEQPPLYDITEIRFNGFNSICFELYTIYIYKDFPIGYYNFEISGIVSLEMFNKDPDKKEYDGFALLDLIVQENSLDGEPYYQFNIYGNQEFTIIAKDANCYHTKDADDIG